MTSYTSYDFDLEIFGGGSADPDLDAAGVEYSPKGIMVNDHLVDHLESFVLGGTNTLL